MPPIIDNIQLDETNVEFNHAADFVKHTDRLIYLTGKAGTGKTTFLKYLRQTTTKNTVIVAPTGVAAINAGGQTIHSFFQIKPGVYVPGDKRLRTRADLYDPDKSTIYHYFKYSKERIELIRGMDLLIIDEISMVRCDLLDVIDRLLRVYRRREFEPFGGVQVILIGDTFQLPPIAEGEQWEILEKFYESPFFFSSKVIQRNKPVYIELKKIYRQNEQEFIDLLNRVRVNQLTQNEINLLNSRLNPAFSPDKNSNYITLATHNSIVNNTNLTKLAGLPTPLHLFEAEVTGTFPDNIMPTDKTLQLKEGAQIMFIRNDKQKRFYNGRIAKIKAIKDNGIIVEFSENNEIAIEKEVWENIRYTWDESKRKIEEEVIGTFTQFPVRLAWAITVHKSQGLTFEKVIADLGGAFTSGQVYVALSRCTSFHGLVLKTRIDRNAIKTDPEVLHFAENETPSTLILQELNSGKADFYYKKARKAVEANNFSSAIDHFMTAIKYRNDTETDIFKRYLVVMLSKLAGNKALAKNLAEKLAKSKIEIEKLSETIKSLQQENGAQRKKGNKQNFFPKSFMDKAKEPERTNPFSERNAAELRIELSKVHDRLRSSQGQNKNQEKKIRELENIIRTQKQGISREQKVK